MNAREVTIRQVQNGYVVKTVSSKEGKTKNVEAMIKLMRSMGVYESWQEHQEEDIRRALQGMALPVSPEREVSEVVCQSFEEVTAFLKKFFESSAGQEDTIFP